MMFEGSIKNTKSIGLARFVKLGVVVMICVLCLVGFTIPTSAEEQNGFIEYKTTVYDDIDEIIKVVLTDKETGYYYTHELYRINDYGANFSIPFGTYSINAELISTTGADLSQYSLVYPKEDIVIKNANLAVPISLSVEVYENVTVGEDDYSEAYTEKTATQEETEVNNEVSGIDEEGEASDSSLLISTIGFAILFVLLGIGYFYFRNRV